MKTIFHGCMPNEPTVLLPGVMIWLLEAIRCRTMETVCWDECQFPRGHTGSTACCPLDSKAPSLRSPEDPERSCPKHHHRNERSPDDMLLERARSISPGASTTAPECASSKQLTRGVYGGSHPWFQGTLAIRRDAWHDAHRALSEMLHGKPDVFMGICAFVQA
jgi:hypothetical protein